MQTIDTSYKTLSERIKELNAQFIHNLTWPYCNGTIKPTDKDNCKVK